MNTEQANTQHLAFQETAKETACLLTTGSEWQEAEEVLKVLRADLDAKLFVQDRSRLLAEGYCLLGVRTEGRMVAVASYLISPHPIYFRELQIHDMATLGEYQSKGFGSKLLAEIEKIASEEKCGRCYVNSRIERDAAHRFYRRNGYEDYSVGFVKKFD